MGKTIVKGSGAEGLPFSEVVAAGGFVFLSGLVAFDSQGKIVSGGIGAETRTIFVDVHRLLALAGAGLDDVVKVNVYLADPADFDAFNEEYRRHFSDAPPARISVSVKLTIDARVELDLIAYVGDRC